MVLKYSAFHNYMMKAAVNSGNIYILEIITIFTCMPV